MRGFAVCVSLVRSFAVCDVIDGTCVIERSVQVSVLTIQSRHPSFSSIERVCVLTIQAHTRALTRGPCTCASERKYDEEYDS